MRSSFAVAAIAALLASPFALAQPANPDGRTPAVSLPNSPRNPDAPVAGANSFTEHQAKSRIEAKGFIEVTDLRKDDQGIWRGSAKMTDGTVVTVSLDFQGNVTTR